MAEVAWWLLIGVGLCWTAFAMLSWFWLSILFMAVRRRGQRPPLGERWMLFMWAWCLGPVFLYILVAEGIQTLKLKRAIKEGNRATDK